jgi:isopentenyldiphosphate isomerase
MKVAARILYYADGCETFAEHELDYIIFLKPKKLTIDFNKDEIK